jgi:hypothetical protein
VTVRCIFEAKPINLFVIMASREKNGRKSSKLGGIEAKMANVRRMMRISSFSKPIFENLIFPERGIVCA